LTLRISLQVPITHQYDHHHNAYLTGKAAKMVHVGPAGSSAPSHGGIRPQWEVRSVPGVPTGAPSLELPPGVELPPGGQLPLSAFLVDGNGGEYRKSWHGTASGFAMLVESPQAFSIQPMMINTRPADGSLKPHGPLPKRSLAPPNASYSGLLECPCTTRKQIVITDHSTQAWGACAQPVADAPSCFTAVAELGLAPLVSNETVATSDTPAGCTASPPRPHPPPHPPTHPHTHTRTHTHTHTHTHPAREDVRGEQPHLPPRFCPRATACAVLASASPTPKAEWF
jgi:hypothetical protein